MSELLKMCFLVELCCKLVFFIGFVLINFCMFILDVKGMFGVCVLFLNIFDFVDLLVCVVFSFCFIKELNRWREFEIIYGCVVMFVFFGFIV